MANDIGPFQNIIEVGWRTDEFNIEESDTGWIISKSTGLTNLSFALFEPFGWDMELVIEGLATYTEDRAQGISAYRRFVSRRPLRFSFAASGGGKSRGGISIFPFAYYQIGDDDVWPPNQTVSISGDKFAGYVIDISVTVGDGILPQPRDPDDRFSMLGTLEIL